MTQEQKPQVLRIGEGGYTDQTPDHVPATFHDELGTKLQDEIGFANAEHLAPRDKYDVVAQDALRLSYYDKLRLIKRLVNSIQNNRTLP